MDRLFALALVVLAGSAVTLVAGAMLRSSATAADASCAADPDCYVSPGIGDAILASRLLVASAVLGLVGLGALALAVGRRKPAAG